MSAVRSLADRLRVDSLVFKGVLVVAATIALTIFIFGGVLHRLFGESGETVRAQFANTVQLKKGVKVRVQGVETGEVKEITVNRGGRSATVEMEVFDDGLPLHGDATATVRWRNVLGGSVIVDIDRGTPAAGALRSHFIPQSRTANQVEIDEIISVFRGEARAGLRGMLAELPRALEDSAAPARALRSLADVSPDLEGAIRAVRGERDGDLRRLVATTARTVQALDSPEEVRDLIAGGAVTLETTARREADVRATIEQVAEVTPRVVATLRRLDGTLSEADPVIARLRGPAGQIAPTVARLRPVVSEADELLQDARPLLRLLRPASASLATTAGEGLPLLRELAPSLQLVDKEILPGLAKRSPITGRATYEMIGPRQASFNGMGAHFDSRGRYLRFPASGSERGPIATPCRSYFTDPEGGGAVAPEQEAPIARCETFTKTLQNFLGWQPLPQPGGTR